MAKFNLYFCNDNNFELAQIMLFEVTNKDEQNVYYQH